MSKSKQVHGSFLWSVERERKIKGPAGRGEM